jgi:2-haloacid dehalogenase
MPIKAFVFDAYGTLYDVQSISTAVEETFPGRSETITQIWRLKQLEYSWLRTLMHRFEDFRTVTRDSLVYTLQILGLPADPDAMDRLVAAYDHLTPYPDAAETLSALKPHRRAILSNGSQPMLGALVRDTGLDRHLDAVISIDAVRAFKPDPRAYALIEQRLGIQPSEVMFVTSNGFDVAGACACGFNVARIVRVTPEALRQELTTKAIGASAFYRALRSQAEMLDQPPTHELNSLRDLIPLTQT